MGSNGYDLKIVFDKLPDVIEQLPEVADAIVRKTTLAIGAEARETSPFKSGHLMNSHQEAFPAPMQGELQVAADYAGYVHDGTRFVAARPWAAQAAMHQYPAFQDAFRALEEIVK